ncbi:sodium:proton antiporter [Lacibacterium aquatile]|uniref:Sodium:proton antiporter n=1 Tax=Lacibacterium aquatile TaxID=1168082 RepID=A0ABW5DTQ4_9PROT
MVSRFIFSLAIMVIAATPAMAATAPHIDGAALGLIWALPFAGILLSIAILPLVAPSFWHHNFGKISAAWSLAFLIPITIQAGVGVALYELLHVLLLDYIPFIILLLALFTVAGGVKIGGTLAGTPTVNLTLLLFGTLLAGFMGTTGAAMLMVRPLLSANHRRKHKVHIFVFFIFLVANIGGGLTPLGDPPLFLGFLKGVEFFWFTEHMILPMLFAIALVGSAFFIVDSYYYRRESDYVRTHEPKRESLHIQGFLNIVLLAGVVGAVLMSGVWKPGIAFTLYHVPIEGQGLARDAILLLITFLSVRLTRQQIRHDNEYSWGPIVEVAKLFAGIFITIIPAIAILRAGASGSLAGLVALANPGGVPSDPVYFWLTGILSSFLDNAPTFLVFFNLAGGDAQHLMGPMASTLLAISAGAVFMGANTYIGNAPNFMVKAVVEHRGVHMPSFFGYMAWSCAVLIPTFLLMTLLFF